MVCCGLLDCLLSVGGGSWIQGLLRYTWLRDISWFWLISHGMAVVSLVFLFVLCKYSCLVTVLGWYKWRWIVYFNYFFWILLDSGDRWRILCLRLVGSDPRPDPGCLGLAPQPSPAWVGINNINTKNIIICIINIIIFIINNIIIIIINKFKKILLILKNNHIFDLNGQIKNYYYYYH